MFLRIWRLITLMLVAFVFTMESAHVLELPQKLQYGPEMYTAVNTTLYRYFAVVGGLYQTSSIFMALVLAFLVRDRQPSFRWTFSGGLCLLAAFGIWLTVVVPVNAMIAEAWRTNAATVPELWLELRTRWESGHAAGFLVQLAGLCALIYSVVVETPRTWQPLSRNDIGRERMFHS